MKIIDGNLTVHSSDHEDGIHVSIKKGMKQPIEFTMPDLMRLVDILLFLTYPHHITLTGLKGRKEN